MPQPTQLASEARSTLAKALEALQSRPDVPDSLLEMAEPIATTMGLLLRIERSNGSDLSGIDEALGSIRTTLEGLQTASGDHPAADAAMEHVAASLSKLFALAKAHKGVAPLAKGPAAAAAPAPLVSAPPTAAMASAADRVAADQAVAEAEERVVSHTQPSRLEPEPEFTPRGTVRMKPGLGEEVRSRAAAQGVGPVGGTLPSSPEHLHLPEHLPQAGRGPAAGYDARTPEAVAYRTPTSEHPRRPPGRTIEVELGAHSSSNFYKGLSGNDVVDHGGIFVQTYTLPKLGDAVTLRVHLPGDLELIADAIVQWTRETRSGESEPGFGARFTNINEEGRQLVYRFVKNREPMFYDDL